MFSAAIALILATIGVAGGYLASTKFMKNEYGDQDKVLWAGMLSVFTVMLVAGQFDMLNEAIWMSYGMFGGFLGGKLSTPLTKMVVRKLIAKTHGKFKMTLRETEAERARRHEVMKLARQRRHKCLHILEQAGDIGGVAALRSNINRIVDVDLPHFLVLRPEIRIALERGRQVLERNELTPKDARNKDFREVIKNSKGDVKMFETKLKDTDESIHLLLRLLDNLTTDCDEIRLAAEGDSLDRLVELIAETNEDIEQVLAAQKEVAGKDIGAKKLPQPTLTGEKTDTAKAAAAKQKIAH